VKLKSQEIAHSSSLDLQFHVLSGLENVLKIKAMLKMDGQYTRECKAASGLHHFLFMKIVNVPM
jgi:hypothetical protein